MRRVGADAALAAPPRSWRRSPTAPDPVPAGGNVSYMRHLRFPAAAAGVALPAPAFARATLAAPAERIGDAAIERDHAACERLQARILGSRLVP